MVQNKNFDTCPKFLFQPHILDKLPGAGDAGGRERRGPETPGAGGAGGRGRRGPGAPFSRK